MSRSPRGSGFNRDGACSRSPDFSQGLLGAAPGLKPGLRCFSRPPAAFTHHTDGGPVKRGPPYARQGLWCRPSSFFANEFASTGPVPPVYCAMCGSSFNRDGVCSRSPGFSPGCRGAGPGLRCFSRPPAAFTHHTDGGPVKRGPPCARQGLWCRPSSFFTNEFASTGPVPPVYCACVGAVSTAMALAVVARTSVRVAGGRSRAEARATVLFTSTGGVYPSHRWWTGEAWSTLRTARAAVPAVEFFRE